VGWTNWGIRYVLVKAVLGKRKMCWDENKILGTVVQVTAVYTLKYEYMCRVSTLCMIILIHVFRP